MKRDMLTNDERKFLATMPSWFELVDQLKLKMRVNDEKEHRAADFIINQLKECSYKEVEYRLGYLELLVFEAEDRK